MEQGPQFSGGYRYNGGFTKGAPAVPPVSLRGHSMKLTGVRNHYLYECSCGGFDARAKSKDHARWLHDNHKAHVAGVAGPSMFGPDGKRLNNYDGVSYPSDQYPSDESLFR